MAFAETHPEAESSTPPPAKSAVSRGRSATEDWSLVLTGLLEGDAWAVARLTNVIMGMLGRMLWEDIAQDVLVSLLGAARQGAIRDPRAFIGYCSVVTRNMVARRLQQTRRARERDGHAEPEELAEPERRDQDPELRIDLLRALELLPEKHRRVVEAIYLEGRSYEDAASALELPLGSLKRLQTQGLRLLRQAMPEDARPAAGVAC
jgi:RNA polymerase sigma-70 factor (ECF subfamily)